MVPEVSGLTFFVVVFVCLVKHVVQTVAFEMRSEQTCLGPKWTGMSKWYL